MLLLVTTTNNNGRPSEMTDPVHAIIANPERGAPIERMSPVVASGLRILEANPNPEALRALLEIQRDWEREESRKAFERAMVALKRDLPTVLHRDKTVDFTGKSGSRTHYTHTSLAAAVDAISSPLTQHGFSHSWTPSTDDRGKVSVTCCLTHVEGHSKETTISAPVDTSGNKGPAQGVASTITLLQRYTLLSLLGIATADQVDPLVEDDGSVRPVDESQRTRPNPDRAIKAVGAITKKGRSREDAEGYLGKRVQDWSDDDIDSLNEWVKRPAEREPGEH
jgi:hypothetical protein